MKIKNLIAIINQQKHLMPMKAHNGGFSLIEFLVVIGAIGIILGIAVPAYTGFREKADIAAAMQDLKIIETAIIELALDTGEWPGHQSLGESCSCPTNEIWNLTDANVGLLADDAGTPYPNWNGPYLTSVPKDPWGMNYFLDTDYEIDGDPNRIAIGSFGPDKLGPMTYDSNNIIIEFPVK